jgi:hypothetical protein
MTQNNIGTPQSRTDSIAVGDWSLDEHMTGKVGGSPSAEIAAIRPDLRNS